MREGAKVLVVASDVYSNDRLVGELLELGFDPTPVFSVEEAVALLGNEHFDALLVQEGIAETSEPLRRWLKAHFRGVVVFVHSYDHDEAGEKAAEAAVLLQKALLKAGMRG